MNTASISPQTTLTAHGIKPSVQRMAVMGYLLENRTHPTVDEIYNALVGSMPTLSKARVYNTLKLLVEKGAALQVNIDGRGACYDGYTDPHAHFLCRCCGKVFDFILKRPRLERLTEAPEDFSIDTAALHFQGTCPDCRQIV